MSCQPKESAFNIKDYPASISSPEDPIARYNYEMRFLVDPKTKQLPDGILKKERDFVSPIFDAKGFPGLRTKSLDYKNVGPDNVGGRTRAIGVDIRNEQILLAGSASGGLWRSTDQGRSWVIVSPQNSINGVTALVQDTRPGKEDTWYYGTGELTGNSARANAFTPFRGDGIFKSEDNGLTWEHLASTFTGDESELDSPFKYVMKLAINQITGEIYAAVFGGVVRSQDEGTTWEVALSNGTTPVTGIETLVDPEASRYSDLTITDSGIIYAALSSITNESGFITSIPGVLRSENGVDWEDITPSGYPQERNRGVLDSRPGSDQFFLFLESAQFGNTAQHLYRYFGDTDTWLNLTDNLPSFGESGVLNTQFSYNMMIRVHPVNREVVFLGATILYRSNNAFNSGTNIDWIGGYNTDGTFDFYPNHHADQHGLIFLPSDPSRALSITDGGVHFTSNILEDQVSWVERNDGYVTSQFYAIGQDKSSFLTDIVGGMQDNGTSLKITGSESQTWSDLAGGDGGFCEITDNGSTLYFSFQFGRVFRGQLNSQSGRTVFTRVDPDFSGENEDVYDFIAPFILDPVNKNRMFLARGNQIVRNLNLDEIPTSESQNKTTVNWDALRTTIVQNQLITSLELSESNPALLYYGTSGGQLFKIDNVEERVPRPIRILNDEFPFATISSVSVHPFFENEVGVVFSNYNVRSIFVSQDGGNSFIDVGGNLEEFEDGTGNGPSIRWMEIVPIRSDLNKYFVGTSSGLFSTESLNGSNTVWVKEAEAEIGRSVIRMMSYRTLDGRLLVSTHGNGVFETFVESDFAQESGEIAFGINNVYPNPVPLGSTFQADFTVPGNGEVSMALYSLNGKRIGDVEHAFFNRGARSISWSQSPKESGLYALVIGQGKESTARYVIYSGK